VSHLAVCLKPVLTIKDQKQVVISKEFGVFKNEKKHPQVIG